MENTKVIQQENDKALQKTLLRDRRYESLRRLLLSLFKSIDMPQSVKTDLETFLTEILAVAKYMFVTKYQTSVPKARPPIGDLPSDDLMKVRFLQSPYVKKAPVRTVALDVIKQFKEFEQYIYHERWVSETLNLELGILSENISNISRILPKLLLESKGIEDISQKQKVLSLIHSSICIYRSFHASAVPDPQTILGTYTGKPLDQIEATYFTKEKIASFIDSIPNLEKAKPFFRMQIYSGNASSPAGGSHDANLLQDVNAIWRDFTIRDSIKRISNYFEGGENFILLVDNLFANTAWDKTFPLTSASRIVTFTAPGAKARTIAVVDWVSQTALSAIHFGTFQVLKLISSDCTFDHPSGLNLFRDKIENFYSLDLSAATDRMPRHLQALVLAGLLNKLGFDGDKISKEWLIIQDRTYETRGSAYEKLHSTLKYSVGNGMGLFSSWTTMALTHHFIVSLTGAKFDEYRLVGDDLLIRGSRSYFDKYLDIMSAIGMSVNTKKTIVSENKRPNIEFARNWIIDGVKILPIRTGVLFAFVDGAVTAETVVWHLREYLHSSNIEDIMSLLDVSSNILQKMQIYYYLYRESILPDLQLNRLITQTPSLKNMTCDLLSKVKQVTTSARMKITPKDAVIKGFYDTLLSQCIVRKPEELSFVVNFAQNIYMIAFADERLIEPAEKFHRRALDANLIKYDVDIKGGPLLTNRERNLIRDLLVSEKAIEKPNKLGPTSKS